MRPRSPSAAVNSLLVQEQRIRLTAFKPASSLHISSIQSLHRIPALPFTNCSSTSAQTLSPSAGSQPLIHTYQAYRLGGVYLLPPASGVLTTSNNLPPHFFRKSSLHHRLTNSFAMSTLSQPQTPAALDSPLREHRHRPVERLTDRLETPSLDDRSYRVVRLPSNQLEVLLVHDADTDKASAAMDVNVGNFSDYEDLPGVAHAVEYASPQSLISKKKANSP